MIKIQNGIATREPIPDFLVGLLPESLLDLSWTDPALGVADCAWWPEQDMSAPMGEFERYGVETLTVDVARQVVLVERAIVSWSSGEIAVLLAERVSQFVRRVDSDVDAIYAAALGNRAPEYDQAALDASAFKAANYTGAVPASVSSWASAKGWMSQAAADDILLAAARLAQARDDIRAARLMRKEQARTAPSPAALSAIDQVWTGFVAVVRAQLGV